MTPVELGNKIVSLNEQWKTISRLSLKELEAVINDPNVTKGKTLYRLERHHRINGGDDAMAIIMGKYGNTHKYTVTRKTSFNIK